MMLGLFRKKKTYASAEGWQLEKFQEACRQFDNDDVVENVLQVAMNHEQRSLDLRGRDDGDDDH